MIGLNLAIRPVPSGVQEGRIELQTAVSPTTSSVVLALVFHLRSYTIQNSQTVNNAKVTYTKNTDL